MIFLLVASYRQGFSHYYASAAFRSGSNADIAAAIDHEPDNPVAHHTEGEVRVRKRDFAAAAAVFERAVALRERDFLLWLHLGYARQQLGQFDAAAEAFETSMSLSPNYSRPPFHMGMMLLDADRDDEAFAHLSKAAELDPTLSSSVQRLARRSFDDAKAIEAALRPVDPASKRSVARYMIKHGYMTDSIKAFLLGRELTAAQKNEFVKYLLHKGNYELAREVWLSRPGNDLAAARMPIYDGGFERITESDPSGLGWQIDQTISETAVARDRDDVHSGEHSLNVRFAGNVDLRRPVVSQLVFVQPGRQYTLAYFVAAGELVSAGLPSIVVSDARSNQVLAISQPIQDTDKKWTQQSISFTAPNSHVIVISLQRPACGTSPCPIFGDLSLDDVVLTERSG